MPHANKNMSTGVRMGTEQYDAQAKAVEHADAWTLAQAARLDTSPAMVLDAIKRGWLPEQIKGVTSKYALEDGPPLGACFTVV